MLAKIVFSITPNEPGIKAARPQYEAKMLLNRQTMIRSTNVQLQKRVAFNAMLPECVGICAWGSFKIHSLIF